MSINPLYNSDLQRLFQRHSQMLDRTYLVIKQRLAERLVADMDKIKAKYDDSSTRLLEAEVQRLGDLKAAAATKLAGIRKSLDSIIDVRDQLTAMRFAAESGNATNFDTAQSLLDGYAGYGVADETNPTGHVVDGTTGLRTMTADLGALGAVYYQVQSLGSRYRLDIVGATGGSPNMSTQKLTIDGNKIDFTSLTLLSKTGTAITFTDGTTTYDATYNAGGVGVASAWLYNNLAGAADQAEAVADVDAALATVDEVERSLLQAEALLGAGISNLDAKLRNLSSDFDAAAEKTLTAREAELKAVQARFDLQSGQIALLGKMQLAQVQLMVPPLQDWDTDVWGTLSIRHAVD